MPASGTVDGNVRIRNTLQWPQLPESRPGSVSWSRAALGDAARFYAARARIVPMIWLICPPGTAGPGRPLRPEAKAALFPSAFVEVEAGFKSANGPRTKFPSRFLIQSIACAGAPGRADHQR